MRLGIRARLIGGFSVLSLVLAGAIGTTVVEVSGLRNVTDRMAQVRVPTAVSAGDLVGEVYADGVCVGCELLREGHVWVYRHFTQDPVLLALEAEARAARRGLWALPEAERVPPWEWRRRQRSAAPLP